MRKQVWKWIAFLALIGTFLSVTLSCRLYDDRIELEKDGVWRYYSIDPDTILESLAQGNTDVFTPLAATPEGELPAPKKLAQWSQEDFFLVAETIHEQSWGEPSGDQNLYNMLFHVNCADVERGTFSDAEFLSFKVIQTEGEEETRIEHWINIMPAIDLVYTVEVAYQPNVHYKVPIDLSQYKVTAGDALLIAEDKGGSAIRLEVNNTCRISVMAPGPDGKGWRVVYVDAYDSLKSLFVIDIDPQTGKYKVLYPKPR
jgi:hypothetical protein